MKENKKIHFGKVLRKLRKERKLTQAELADRCSLHPTFISQLERDCKYPTLPTIWALAEGLEISASEFIRMVEEKPENNWLTKHLMNTPDAGGVIFTLLLALAFLWDYSELFDMLL